MTAPIKRGDPRAPAGADPDPEVTTKRGKIGISPHFSERSVCVMGAISWVILATSITNLVLAIAVLDLLRRGYSQARQQTRVLVLSTDGELLTEQRNGAIRRTAIVGSDGGLLYPNGRNGYDRRLRALPLERGVVSDVWVVPRT